MATSRSEPSRSMSLTRVRSARFVQGSLKQCCGSYGPPAGGVVRNCFMRSNLSVIVRSYFLGKPFLG